MRSCSREICQRLQRTGNLLPSCNVTRNISRVPTTIQFNQTCTTFPQQVLTRFYSNNNYPEKLTSRSLVRTDTTKESISRIEMLGLAASDLSKPDLYNVPLGVIEQRLQYCVEGGIKGCSDCVVRFNQLIDQPVSVLKTANFIEKTDVVKEILNSIKFVGPYPSIDKNLSYREIHFRVLNHCMEYEFNYTFTNWQRYHEAPVAYAHQNIVTVKQGGLNWSWVRNHPSLLCFANPYNLFKIFELDRSYELPVSMGYIISKDADVAFIPYEDLKAAFFILKKYNVCHHDMSKVIKMEHFLINPDYLNRQFQKIDTEPKSNKNNLLLLYKSSLTTSEKKRNISHLEKLIARQCSPQTILSSAPEGSWQHEMKLWLDSGDFSLEYKPCHHKPYDLIGGDYLEEYTDISYPIDEKKKELQSKKKNSKLPDMLAEELNLPIDKVKVELARIPLALTFQTKHSYETLRLLRSKGFTQEEIAESLQLLLYKREVVEEILENHIFPDGDLQSETYKGRRLHVCLYHILMKYNYNLCPS